MDMVWDGSLAVGNAVIDQEHRTLFGIFSQLQGAILDGSGGSAIGPILCALSDYIGVHFDHEEHLMLRYGYAGYAGHKAQHDDLLQGLSQLIYRFEMGEQQVTLDTLDFLHTWLSVHIRQEDLKLATALRRPAA